MIQPQRVAPKKLDHPEETPDSIDDDALLLAFNDADLSPVRPVHPKRLLRVLR
jgi:hypothetical protein